IRFVGGSVISTLTAPALVFPQNNARSVPPTVLLQWSAVSGAASYRVQLSYGSDFATKITDQSNVTATTFTARSLASYRRVYWRVAAIGSSGTAGPWSQTWNFRTGSFSLSGG